MKAEDNPVLIDVPMPIRTPRLLIRPPQSGDGAITASAVDETWEDLHQWMGWAETLADNTVEQREIRTRQIMAKFVLREEFNLLGVEIASGQNVIWCGFHGVDWKARQCETGFWVRKSAQGRGFATEATNALLRYAFGALGMRRVGITHSSGNEASRRVVEKLGFASEGIQRAANLLPGGRIADRHLYARFDTVGLPPLEVQWDRL
ncbi:MAG TPA: GNAT family N-acetyltransferase [Granulicella sp.]|jgi:RimJ/RimL family protein N-acetyltransferase